MEQIASDLAYGIATQRAEIAKTRHREDLRDALEQTIHVIAETVDQRDPYTAGHERRVADLCVHIAQKLGLPEDRTHGIHLAASIHDLGKIGIPAEILSKPGLLTPTQFNLLKEHAQLGYDILKDVAFPWPIADAILQHHERLDGSGYPLGLQGDAISLEARILAVADVVEAMSSHRPYRAAQGVEVALDEILAQRGSLYDAQVADACVQVFREDGYGFPGVGPKA
jgi:HD-GYP domain-containing protein (c-di-GMP phosphodiesterase class II)